MNLTFTGRSTTGAPIVSGAYNLHMRDTHGIPLDVQCAILNERGWGFDVMGFISACHGNPNYGLAKCLGMLKATTEDADHHRMFELSIKRHLDT